MEGGVGCVPVVVVAVLWAEQNCIAARDTLAAPTPSPHTPPPSLPPLPHQKKKDTTDCAVSGAGPLLARLSRCAPHAAAAQHHALDTLLDASPPNPGTDVNEPEAAADHPLEEGADTAAAHPRTVRFTRVKGSRRLRRRLLGDDDDDDDDDGDDEYKQCADGVCPGGRRAP